MKPRVTLFCHRSHGLVVMMPDIASSILTGCMKLLGGVWKQCIGQLMRSVTSFTTSRVAHRRRPAACVARTAVVILILKLDERGTSNATWVIRRCQVSREKDDKRGDGPVMVCLA
eukprot:3200021-Amphidinium_carterae.1